jgi:HEAT repeat protein
LEDGVTTEQLVNELRAATLHDPQSRRVREVKQALADRGEGVLAQLGSLLIDSSLDVREGAADVLELIGTEIAYERLVDFALRNLEDPAKQTKLPGPGWRRLRQLGRPVLAALERAYRSSLPFDTRLTMIFIVQQIGDPEGQPLIARALSESDPRIVEAAGEALGSIDGPQAYERLVELLNAPDIHHRLGAIRGFQRLGDKAAVRPLFERMTSEDETIPAWGGSRGAAGSNLSALIADVIDSLTGAPLKGDINNIRSWLDTHSV